jgi:diadenosine tetraphosphatase ApaH/serine/threonine PP2A family protein phosphatase
VLSPLDCPEFTIVHGSLHDPLRQYLATVRDADETFALLESPYCIVGHTHVPLIFRSGQRGEPSREGASPGHRALKIHGDPMIFNPGSVGQPRDGNSQASYMLWDGTEGEISYRRVRYDVAHTERLMLLNNLPPRLSQRLFYGW